MALNVSVALEKDKQREVEDKQRVRLMTEGRAELCWPEASESIIALFLSLNVNVAKPPKI